MDKGGGASPQVQPMQTGSMPSGKGGSTPMQTPPMQPPGGGGLAALFANNQPAVQPGSGMQMPGGQMPPPSMGKGAGSPQIMAPQYGPPLMPSPQQAMEATRARMLARTPPPPAVATAAAPVKTDPNVFTRNNNGGNR